MKKLLIGSSALVVLILSGCTSSTEPSPKVSSEATLNKAINCTTAEADISTLTSQKKSEETVSGLLSFTPVGLLTNAATSPSGEEKTSIKEHNKMIDAKIADIKKTCNIK